VPDLIEHGVDPLAFRWLTFQTRYRSEMDFTWDSMDAADAKVKQLRRRMQGWAPAAPHLGDAALAYDARFRTAVATDLDMPASVVVVNEVVSATDVSDGEKYALLASWDAVLGLDLEREATSGWMPTDEMRAMVSARDAAREAKDYAESDRLRDELAAMGLEVMDSPDGTTVRPRD
jgi:cysteinyl-tRNA synthetase